MRIDSAVLGTTHNGTYETRIERGVGMICLVMAFADADAIAYPATLETMFSGYEVTMSFDNARNKQDWSYNSVSLATIIEYATRSEGVVEITLNGAGTFVNAISCKIPVSNFGELLMEQNEAVNLEITGLPTTATHSITVYATDSSISSSQLVQFHEQTIPSGQKAKPFQVQDFDEFIIPITGTKLERVVITASNGKTYERYLDELKIEQASTNDVVAVCSDGTVIGGYDSIVVLPLVDVVEIDIVTDKTGLTCYGVSHTVVSRQARVNRINEALVDTTEVTKLAQIKAIG